MSLAMTAGVKNLLGLLGFMAALSVCVLAERLYRRRSDARWIWLGASGLLTAGLQAAAVLRTDAGGLGSFLGQLIAFVALINAGLSASWYRKRLLGQAKTTAALAITALGLICAGAALPLGHLPLVLLIGVGPAVTAALLWLYGFPRMVASWRSGLAPALTLAGAALAVAGLSELQFRLLNQLYLLLAFLLLISGLWEQIVEMPMVASRRLLNIQRLETGRRQQGAVRLEQERQVQDEALDHLGAVLNRKGTLTSMLADLVNDAARYFGTGHVYVSLLEGAPPLFWVVAYRGDFQFKETSLDHKFMGKVYESGQTAQVGDFLEYLPRARPEIARNGLRAMLGAPVMVDGQLAGVIEIYFSLPGAIPEKFIRMAKIYADQIAVALRIARLQDEGAKKDDELALLHEVAWLVMDQSSPVMLLTRVGKMISKFLRADASAIFYVQRQTGSPQIRSVQVDGFSRLDVERLESLFAKGQLSGMRHNEHGGVERRSAMASLTLATGKTVEVLPLFFRQTLQGVMVFFWDYERKADKGLAPQNTLETMAALTAMGLERDYLYGSIRKMGLTDTLTEIANRRFFDYNIKREFSRLRRYGRPLSLMMVDIDFFKKVNDTWGHQTGDAILKEMGALLKSGFRVTDFPARYGGEEFAVVLPETTAEAAYGLAEKFRVMVSGRIFCPQNERISLTISIGIATFDAQATAAGSLTEVDLILAADQSLYRAKHFGRNRTESWDGTWQGNARA